MRSEHCSFYQNNGNGRCIANCHYNQPTYQENPVDCLGNTGASMNSKYHHEVRVTMQFIDYRTTSQGRREALRERVNQQYGY